MTHPDDASGGVLIEMVDPLTGAIESSGDVSSFREANIEDDDVLAALDRLASGESTLEAIGFYVLRLAQAVAT